MPAEFNIVADCAAGGQSVDGTNPERPPRALCDGVTIVPISIHGLAAGTQADNDKPRATLAGLMRLEPGSEARLEAAGCGEARLEVDCARDTGSNAANVATFSFAEHVCSKAGPAEVVRAMSSGSSGRDCMPLTSDAPVFAAVSQKWGLMNALGATFVWIVASLAVPRTVLTSASSMSQTIIDNAVNCCSCRDLSLRNSWSKKPRRSSDTSAATALQCFF